MPKKNKQNDRMAESDWTRMGPEEAEIKQRSNNVPPDGISEEIWTTVPAEVRCFVLDQLGLKAKRRRPRP